jgi:hypothetical protein
MHTDPSLMHIMVQQLPHWRHGAEGSNFTPAELRKLLQEQHQVGWDRFLKDGWLWNGLLHNSGTML